MTFAFYFIHRKLCSWNKSVPPGTQVSISSSLDVTQNKYFCPYELPSVDIPNDTTDLQDLILQTLRKSFSKRLETHQVEHFF